MVPMIRQVAAVNIEANMSELLQGESVPCEEENNCGAKQQKNQSLKETIEPRELVALQHSRDALVVV